MDSTRTNLSVLLLTDFAWLPSPLQRGVLDKMRNNVGKHSVACVSVCIMFYAIYYFRLDYALLVPAGLTQHKWKLTCPQPFTLSNTTLTGAFPLSHSLNHFPPKSDLTDFTLSNARRFCSSKGDPFRAKGLRGETLNYKIAQNGCYG